jgi:hypothetical protein
MEVLEQEKSANQTWKESGTTLSFSQWLEREKAKGAFIPNKMVADTTASIKAKLGIGSESDNLVITPENQNTVLGLNKWILISSVVIIVGAIAFSVYKKRK